MNGKKRLVVVADANVLITMIETNELQMLSNIEGYRFAVTVDVVAEVLRPLQKQILIQAIQDGCLDQITVDDPVELKLLGELKELRLGQGESASIAVAQNRGWHFATDEKRKCRKEAIQRLGIERLLTTEDIRILIKR